jgi:preprotein translocase subunit SecB
MVQEQGKPGGNGNGGAGNGNGPAVAGRVFLLQQLYVKDLSFEAPNSPGIFQIAGIEPETELNIRNSHTTYENSQYEVVLHIRVHARKDAQTIFLAEIDQAGLFRIDGYSAEQTNTLLATQCPATLFPYARESIASLVGKGGFPPLILQPISFDALYAQARERQKLQA